MRKLLILLALLMAPAAWAQTGFFYNIDPPAPGANLRVCVLPTPGPAPNPCTTPASLFSDAALTVPAANPVTLGPSGNYGFWVAANQYVIQLTGTVNRSIVVTLGGGSGGAGTLPRLDQVLDPNVSKSFNLGATTLTFGSGVLNLSTLTAPVTLPSINNCTPTIAAQICFDNNVNNNNYLGSEGIPVVFGVFDPTAFTSGDLVGLTKTSGNWQMLDLGPPSGNPGDTFITAQITNIREGDSLCWDAGLGTFVNCTEGVPPNIQTGTTYTVDCATDRGSYLLFNNTSPITVTLPQASTSTTCDANFFTFIRTLNADLTITPTTSTIDNGSGAVATDVLHPGYGASIFSDDTNYFAKDGPYRENSFPLMSTEGFDVNTLGHFAWQALNNASTGTVLNKMICDDGAGKVLTCAFATAATNNPVGSATVGLGATPGTTGSTGVCTVGFCSVIFDNSATALHFAQLSTSVNGDLHDTGSTSAPTNGQPFWFVFSGNSGAGTAAIIRNLSPSELNAAAVNGNGKSTVQVNGVNTQPIANFATGGGVTWSKVDSGNTSTITATAAGGITSINAATGPAITVAGAGSTNVTTVGNTVTVTGANGAPSPFVNVQTGTTYTVQNSDNTARDVFTNTATVAVTLPQANTVTLNPFVALRFSGTPSCTTACTTTTFSQTAGDTSFIQIFWNNNATTISSVTAANGDVVTQVGTAQPAFDAGTRSMAVYKIDTETATGSQAITVNFSSSSISLQYIQVIEYKMNGAIDHQGQAFNTTGVPSVTLPVSFPTELAVEFNQGTSTQSTCSFGWTKRSGFGGGTQICEQLLAGQSSVSYSTVSPSTTDGTALNVVDYPIGGVISFQSGWYAVFENKNSPLVTITPTTSTINVDGVAKTSLVIPKGRTCSIMSDGTNYDATCWGTTQNLTTAIHQTAQTGAISTATLCAASPGACDVAGEYHVHWNFGETGTACGTPGAGGVTFLLTWTDTNGTAHSAISVPMDDSASLTATSGTFTFRTTLAAAWASGDFNISTNGSIIQYATGYTACGVGTGTYQLDAIVTKLQY